MADANKDLDPDILEDVMFDNVGDDQGNNRDDGGIIGGSFDSLELDAVNEDPDAILDAPREATPQPNMDPEDDAIREEAGAAIKTDAFPAAELDVDDVVDEMGELQAFMYPPQLQSPKANAGPGEFGETVVEEEFEKTNLSFSRTRPGGTIMIADMPVNEASPEKKRKKSKRSKSLTHGAKQKKQNSLGAACEKMCSGFLRPESDIGVFTRTRGYPIIVSVAVRFPSLLVIPLIPTIVFMILAVLSPADFNRSGIEFTVVSHPIAQALSAAEGVQAEWSTLLANGRFDGGERTLPKYRLFLQFSSRHDGENMFNETLFRLMQQVEDLALTARHYGIICWTNNRKHDFRTKTYPECVPLSSLTTYFFPGKVNAAEDGYVDFEYSGRGNNFQLPPTQVVKTIMQNQNWRWFMDRDVNSTYLHAKFLRSQVTLGFPITDPESNRQITLDEFNALVDEYVVDFANNVSSVADADLRVSIGGDRLIEALVGNVLLSQLNLTAIAIAIVFVFLTVQMQSIILPACAGAQLVLTYLSAFYLYSFQMPVQDMSLMSALSLFVALTLNLDGVLATYEAFRQSGQMQHTERIGSLTMRQRATYTYRYGVFGAVLSHLVALGAFGCAAFSPVPAIKNFSVMMMIIFGIDAYMQLLVFPLALLFHHYYFSNWPGNLQHEGRNDTQPEQRKRSIHLKAFLRAEEVTKDLYGEVSYKDSCATIKAGLEFGKQVDYYMMLVEQARRRRSFREKPSQNTYESLRMVPLIAVFQIHKQFQRIDKSASAVRNAIASYTRRLKGTWDDKIIRPAQMGSDGSIAGLPTNIAVSAWQIKWHYIARFLGTSRPDDFSSGISQQMCDALQRDSCIGPPLKDTTPTTVIPWAGHEFSYRCPAAFLRRPTREEKDTQLMNRYHTHVGAMPLPKFFQAFWIPTVYKLKYLVVLLGVALWAMSLVFAVQMNMLKGPPAMLATTSDAINDFARMSSTFGIAGYCDFCSAYQQPPAALPSWPLLAVQQCMMEGYGVQMHAFVDRCGICFGNNSCVDCLNRPGGQEQVDNCSACLNPFDSSWNRCISCQFNPNSPDVCWPCEPIVNSSTYGGQNCAVFCDERICPPDRGACNKYTGVCECHQSHEKGFFVDDPTLASNPDVTARKYCSQCAPGISPPADGTALNPCTIECDQFSSAKCACVNGECTNCSAATFGPDCNMRRISGCRNGYLDVSGNCICREPLLDAECKYHKECNYRGIYYYPFESIVTGCACKNQFRGAKCSYCLCYNGGVCDGEGICHCLGGWTGFDCSVCNSTCALHGLCPRPWLAENYPEETCAPAFCDIADLDNGIVCPECNRKNPLCNSYDNDLLCDGETGCEWNNETAVCDSTWPQVPPTYNQVYCTKCLGVWEGELCETCPALQLNLSCSSDGKIIGCDGIETEYGFPFKTWDQCGVCSGNGHCLGCDGIRGSTLAYDSCGVCGGSNQCEDPTQVRKETVIARYVWGIIPNQDTKNGTTGLFRYDPDFSLSDTKFQLFLYQRCEELLDRDDLLIAAQSRCVWKDFVDWMVLDSTRIAYNDTVPSLGFPYPQPSSFPNALDWLFFQYAKANNRFSEVGFSDREGRNVTALWVQIRFSTRTPVDSLPGVLLQQYHVFDALREVWELHPLNRGKIIIVSDAWVQALSEISAVTVMAFAFSLSIITWIFISSLTSASPILVALGIFCISGVVGAVYGMFYLLGRSIGPVEQVAMCITASFSVEHHLHASFEYVQYIPKSEAKIVEPGVVRKQAVFTTFSRVGPCIVVSAACAMVATSTVAFSIVAVFRSLGITILMTNVASVFYNLCWFPAALSAFGPARMHRFAYLRLTTVVVFLVLLAIVAAILQGAGVFPNIGSGIIEV